jgi:hypothetical protein
LKERHPETYVLNAIRSRARQRKLPFTITLVEFRQWCKETGYIEKRGHGAGFATIDRMDHSKGYHIWNIQIMEFMENCTNGHTVPGKYLPQNYRKPKDYEYDFNGPDPDPQPATENEPF